MLFVTDAVTICEINFFMIHALALACVLGKFWNVFVPDGRMHFSQCTVLYVLYAHGRCALQCH